MGNIRRWLKEHDAKSSMAGSIVRLEVVVGEQAAQAIDTAEIVRFLVRDLGISNCVNVHAVMPVKRQLRDASITEKIDPKASFVKYLDLVIDDIAFRDRLRKRGLEIMEEAGA